MPIDHMNRYYPKLALPLYTKIADPKMNEYNVGEKYDIRLEDRERQHERGGTGPFNYIHEALLIMKEETTWGEIDDIVIAFDSHSVKRSEAEKRLFPHLEKVEDDYGVEFCIFLRLDMVKDFVEEGPGAIHETFSKEAVEGNGRFMDTE